MWQKEKRSIIFLILWKEKKIILIRTDSITELQYETIITTTNVLTEQLLM